MTGASPDDLVQEVQHHLHEVVGLHRAAGDVDDRQPGARLEVPAEVVGEAHGAGRVALHRMDPAVRRTRAGRDNRERLRREPVDPLVGGDRLPRRRVGADRRPVAAVVRVELLVGDRSLDDQHERVELTTRGGEPRLEEVVAVVVGEHRVVQVDGGQTRDRTEQDVLDAGLGRRGDRDGVTVAAEPGGDPHDVDVLDGRLLLCLPSVRRGLGHHSAHLPGCSGTACARSPREAAQRTRGPTPRQYVRAPPTTRVELDPRSAVAFCVRRVHGRVAGRLRRVFASVPTTGVRSCERWRDSSSEGTPR